MSIFLLLIPILIILFFFINPRTTVLCYCASRYTIDLLWPYQLWENINVLRIIGVVFPFLLFVYFLQNRQKVYQSPLWKAALLLLITQLLSSIWAIVINQFDIVFLPHSHITIKHIIEWNFRVLNLLSCMIIVPFILNKRSDPMMVIWAFLISTIAPILISLIQITSIPFSALFENVGHDYSVSLFPRIKSLYHDSGTLAMMASTAILSSTYIILRVKSFFLKIILSLYIILSLAVLYLSFSRTFWISTALALLLYFNFTRKLHMLLTTLLIIIFLFTCIPLTKKRFEREIQFINNSSYTIDTNGAEKLGTGRIWIWNDARKHYLNLDWASKIIGSGGSYSSHNQYIAWLLRNGILGVIAWAFFFFLILKTMIKNLIVLNFHRYMLFSVILLFVTLLLSNMVMQPWDNISFSSFFGIVVGMGIHQNFQRPS